MSGTGHSATIGDMSGTRHSTCPPGFRLAVVVGSLGALPVLRSLVAGLPPSFPVPVLAVLHRTASRHTGQLAALLQRDTSLPVRTATPGLSAWLPGITVIPGGSCATMNSAGELGLHPVAGRDLGGDGLLDSAAAAARPSPAIGVVLSGMLRDGTDGVRTIKRNGGRVLVQDPATARASSMPASAIATGCVDYVLPPHRLAPALIALVMAPGGASLLAVPTPHWVQLSPA
jgi:two-component system, chemotaxis family, protein-glutamate methylesterase/glutaminase